jgi:sugar lactone lactonase YvrE
MNPRLVPSVAALALLTACAPTERPDAEAAAPAVALDIADVGFATPECVLHDPAADVYLVSNINGGPADKDDNGFVSRLSPSGELLALKWIDGAAANVTLHGPKGMVVRNDTLFVADIDAVRLFDRASGAPLGEWALDGAAFLNDLAVGPDGTIYLTDTGVEPSEGGLTPNGKDGVYRREGDRWVAIVSGAGLGNPNGVIVDSSGVTVVTFVSGEVYSLDPISGARTMLPKPDQGGLDGVIRLADGSLLIASWGARGVYRLAPTGTFGRQGNDTVGSPADIGFDAVRSAMLIPDFSADRVLIRPVQ